MKQSFGADIDYAKPVKIYGDAPGQGRYSPGECTGAVRRRIGRTEGHPGCGWGSRRFTHLTNAFSKKVENHAHSVALHAMHYNFVLRAHSPNAAGYASDGDWRDG